MITEKYVLISQKFLESSKEMPASSLKVLIFMMTKPPSFRWHANILASETCLSLNTVRSVLKELCASGYVVRYYLPTGRGRGIALFAVRNERIQPTSYRRNKRGSQSQQDICRDSQ